MKSRLVILIILGLFFCSSCENQQMIRDVKTLCGSKIKIPENMSVRILGRDTLLQVKQKGYATMIIWFDSIQCATCNMNNIENWNEIFEYSRDSVKGFNPIIIFSPNKKDMCRLETSLRLTKFIYPIFVDYNSTLLST